MRSWGWQRSTRPRVPRCRRLRCGAGAPQQHAGRAGCRVMRARTHARPARAPQTRLQEALSAARTVIAELSSVMHGRVASVLAMLLDRFAGQVHENLSLATRLQQARGSMIVVARVRPLNDEEAAAAGGGAVDVLSDSELVRAASSPSPPVALCDAARWLGVGTGMARRAQLIVAPVRVRPRAWPVRVAGGGVPRGGAFGAGRCGRILLVRLLRCVRPASSGGARGGGDAACCLDTV